MASLPRPGDALRGGILRAAESPGLRKAVEKAPVSRSVVARYVAGTTSADAVRVAKELLARDLHVTLDHLGEDTTDRRQATATTTAYVDVLALLASSGLTADARVEVSVKLSAIGQALGDDGPKIATENAFAICEAARSHGTTVTLDMEDHTTTDHTLTTLQELRATFPWVGGVLQAYLRRTEGDCRDLAGVGSRVRLCKGAYDEPSSVAYTSAGDIDRSYARCLKILVKGQGYPMIATHDPRLVEIAQALVSHEGRTTDSYEFQMLHGIRPKEHDRLVRAGETVRVYVPYGREWYGYLMRRMAERPTNTALFARSLVTRG